MPFDPDKFKNTCSGIQSIFIVIAIIVGGVWTLISLDLFGQIDRAKAELKQIQKQLKDQSVLIIEIAPSVVILPDDNHKFLSVEVKVRNSGDRNTLLQYDENLPPFRAWPVKIDKSGSLDFGVPIKAYPTSTNLPGIARVSATSVWAGQEKTIPFFIRIPVSGLYFLSFSVNVPSQKLKEFAEAGVEVKAGLDLEAGLDVEKTNVVWTANKYYVVP